MMDEQQQLFWERRNRLLNAWKFVGPLLLLSIVGLLLWFYLRNPLLVNPFEIATRLDNETLQQSTLVIMAVMLPIMFLACFVLLLAIIGLMYAAFFNEKKYRQIINKLINA